MVNFDSVVDTGFLLHSTQSSNNYHFRITFKKTMNCFFLQTNLFISKWRLLHGNGSRRLQVHHRHRDQRAHRRLLDGQRLRGRHRGQRSVRKVAAWCGELHMASEDFGTHRRLPLRRRRPKHPQDPRGDWSGHDHIWHFGAVQV